MSPSNRVREWLLDPGSHYQPGEDLRLVKSEREFLKAFQSSDSLLIQGRSLVRWAQEVARARGIEWKQLRSPVDALKQMAPTLSDDEATQILDKLGTRTWEFDTSNQLGITTVLSWLDESGPWAGPQDQVHAINWLIWWAEPKDSLLVPLASVAGQQLADSTEDVLLRELFAVHSEEDALQQLEVIAGLHYGRTSEVTSDHLELNHQIQQKLVNRFKVRIASEPVNDEFNFTRVARSLRRPIAEVVVSQLAANKRVTRRLYAKLRQVVGQSGIAPIADFVLVEDPGSTPQVPADVLKWYEHRYLPWRTSPSADSTRALEIGEEFTTWLLENLPKVRTSADNQQHLAWVAVDRIHQANKNDLITLLVVADGLGIGDIEFLSESLRNALDLNITDSQYLFTQIPTVTELTKSRIVNGDLVTSEVEEVGDRVSRIDDIIERLRVASPGSFIAWTHVQPDRAYHFATGELQLKKEVSSQLRLISEGIKEVLELNLSAPLRVILTADHGRYFGACERVLNAPEGLVPHGRAAWGKSERQIKEVFLREGDLVWLNPASFGLSSDQSYVAALNDYAFKTKDGKSGKELYPHGGLSPEEVIVPWLEIRKNVQLLPINVEATGEGEAGKSGEVLISVANPNDFPVRLASFELKHPRLVGAGDYQIQSQGSALVPTSLQQVELRPLGSRELRATWATWPFEQSETTTEGVLIYHLPSGEERTESCAVSLVTKALYSSTLSLDDLEDF